MISKKMLGMLNEHLNEELYSSYLYLAMAAYSHSLNWSGFAHWFSIQAKEELAHGMKFYKHIVERGEVVALEAIKKPKAEWKTIAAMFEETLKHEQSITARIYALVEHAQKEKDFATLNFLQWFVSEQVEEEAQTMDVVQKLLMIGDSKGSLFMLDHHLGKRE
jgi:ferritin